MATTTTKRTRAVAVVLATAVAAGLLVLAGTPREAGAIFPGKNGKIAFASFRDGNWDVYVANADGSGATNVSKGGYHGGFDPSFSPDGEKVAFSSGRDGNDEIYVANADGSGTPTNVSNNTAFDYQPSFSPDGKKVVFYSDRDGNGEVYVANADGSDTPQNVSNDAAWDGDPSFSPDGKKVAFQSNRDGNSEVYVMNADGSGTPINVSNNAAYDYHPSFSPDGARVTFIREERYGVDTRVYVAKADGSGSPIRISSINVSSWDGDRGAYFSPDGKKVIFSGYREDGNREIFVANADGSGTPTNVSNDAAGDYTPDWGRMPPPPMVTARSPEAGDTGTLRHQGVEASFNVEVDPATITSSTFKLQQWNKKKKRWQAVPVGVVCLDFPCTTAYLDPYPDDGRQLAANARHRVTVTTGVKDEANAVALDQDPIKAGNQSAVWTFTTGGT